MTSASVLPMNVKHTAFLPPEEAGYELADASGEVIAEIELAWIEKKIGFMTEDQSADIEKGQRLQVGRYLPYRMR